MNEAPPADTIIDARWIAPVEPPGALLHEHSLVIHQGQIVEIVPTTKTAQYQVTDRYALNDHILIPGLVNLHTCAAMTLLRGIADDLGLSDQQNALAWPVDVQILSEDLVRDGALHACAEMLRAGITCFNDTSFFPAATAQAALQAGIRAALGIFIAESASPYCSDAADCLAKGLALRDSLRDEPLLSFCMAPHASHAVSDESFERIAIYAAELELPVHIPLHETHEEIRASIGRHHQRPLQRLQSLGLLGPAFIAVHAVHLEPAELALLAQHGCHVAHCPVSNLKRASGIAPICELQTKGINIGLGTDSAASNNRLDILSEMRFASLLAKGTSGDPAALPARQVLEMATINGARALGLDSLIGSLKAGKRADVVAVNLRPLEVTSSYDPLSTLVYAAGREHVSHAWVDGRLTLEQGRLITLDEAEVRSKATYWRDKLRKQD
jgi:5-methylthioadenosine/S-adenosylhomocysteine deaminase